jgi:hypothetical protein
MVQHGHCGTERLASSHILDVAAAPRLRFDSFQRSPLRVAERHELRALLAALTRYLRNMIRAKWRRMYMIATVFLYSCVPVFLRSCVPVFLCSCVPVFLCSCVPVFLCSCVPVFLCCGAAGADERWVAGFEKDLPAHSLSHTSKNHSSRFRFSTKRAGSEHH